ncbi:MAG: DUF1223 domain-containing protein [Acidobacteria bacterium]|nr:DUF1223 domain-containing protein [Acidobacteriota bacterium]MBI3473413.1 DUF1223 domain-containing protein [Candidatus Solibacter usitatus]
MRLFFQYSFLIAATAAAAERAPVLVELYTSEGCSSCPPADELLMRLDTTQPAPAAEIIALELHVDYWNRLGWSDPFSSAAFTARQQQYGAVFRRDGVYTPQMVVDGRTEFVGSDSRRAAAAIAEAAQAPKAQILIGYLHGRLRVRVDGLPRGAGDADVFLAITEDGLQSDVRRGENQGRLMKHRAVVRRLDYLTTIRLAPWTNELKLKLDKSWKAENLSAVLFLQDRDNRRILGAARVRLAGSP